MKCSSLVVKRSPKGKLCPTSELYLFLDTLVGQSSKCQAADSGKLPVPQCVTLELFKIGDLSASETTDQALTDAKVRLIIDTQDPSIVDDLRHHNPGRPSKYEKFWEECKKFLNDEIETAVDERRHGQLTHLAKAISVKDMLQQVSQRCPPNTPIPMAEATVLAQKSNCQNSTPVYRQAGCEVHGTSPTTTKMA